MYFVTHFNAHEHNSYHWMPPNIPFCYFLKHFLFLFYLYDEHMTTNDCYLHVSIKTPCYLNEYSIYNIFTMAFVTYIDFEL